jgi:hypothetical protein
MSYKLKDPLNKLILFMVRRPTEVPMVQAHYERNQPLIVRSRLHGQIYCSCNICIHHIPVVYAGGRVPTVGASPKAPTVGKQRMERLPRASRRT